MRGPARTALRGPLSAAGLNASWEFYAPNPLTDSFDVYAYVVRSDGSTERYDFPDTTDNFVCTYWTARWAEYEESLAYSPALRPAAAARIALEAADRGEVVAVEIVVRIGHPPPHRDGAVDPDWGPEEVLFRLDLEGAG